MSFPGVWRPLVVLSLFTGTAVSAGSPSSAGARPLVLLIQPIHNEEQTRRAHQPLADYLGRSLRREVTILAPPNPVAYWGLVRRKPGYDLALDEAHFTDYRIQHHGFKVLVKAPGSMSYSLVVTDALRIRDPMELVGKRVASLGLPSIGAVRLTAMYLNPSRQPHILVTADIEAALEQLRKGRAQAAILPTDTVRAQMERGLRLRVITTTEPIPHIALSAAPGLDGQTRERIRQLLLKAHRSPDGRDMLTAIGFPGFEPASADLYAGHARALEKYWGY